MCLLSKTLFYSDWAKNYLDQLDTDPELSADEQIQRWRRQKVEKDYVATVRIEDMLTDLLEKDRYNHMAFEYQMAWYILTKQLDKFIENSTKYQNKNNTFYYYLSITFN